MTATPDRLTGRLLRVLETGVNRILALDPDAPERLAPLAGHTVDVELTEPETLVRVEFDEHGLSLASLNAETPADDADARLRGTLGGLVILATSRGERSRDIRFEGDVALIQALRRLFAELEVDWEEQIARLTGDVAAHQIGRSARGSAAWAKRSGNALLTDLGEYLTEERRLLPTLAEVEDFLADVDRLRDDSDRLEARLRRLERRQHNGGKR